jgi:hypothetical protein
VAGLATTAGLTIAPYREHQQRPGSRPRAAGPVREDGVVDEDQRRLELERTTAAERGLPYAEPVELRVGWDAGAPRPVLLSGLRTFVAFYSGSHDGIGIVEFKQVTSVKIGSPNDEVLHGHPLWGSGLEPYRAHVVRNSLWITELMNVNRVHERFDETRWGGTYHFVLTFHDETLECVARRTVARTAPGATMQEVIARLSREAL